MVFRVRVSMDLQPKCSAGSETTAEQSSSLFQDVKSSSPNAAFISSSEGIMALKPIPEA